MAATEISHICRNSKLLFFKYRCLASLINARCTSTNSNLSRHQANALRPKKDKSKRDQPQTFVDWKKIAAYGGRGGNGACNFQQLWCNPQAGPSGGDGGNGGHVIFRASSNVSSLARLSSVFYAAHGENGSRKDRTGKCAEDTIVEVPVGTTFKNLSGKVIIDLTEEGSVFVAARGGSGGKGNHFFLSNELRKPEVSEDGAEGEAAEYYVQLNTIAHVGLIGFPNAGKSTLLRAISRAKPKVASYPFTTLKPHIGVVHFDDHSQLLVADIPGLIPGAHKDKGLGFTFLRHIERCLCLVYIIDLSLPQPWTQLDVLRFELDQYRPGLSQRPHAVVGNKIDLAESLENFNELEKRCSIPIYPISAKLGNNVRKLITHLRDIYDSQTEVLKTKT